MARFSTLFLCIVLAAGCLAAETPVQSLKADVEIVDDIDAYLAEHPDVKLTQLDSEVLAFGQMRLAFGQRVPGDRVVAQGNNNINYPRVQDVRANLKYPQSGVGAIVSYVDVTVEVNNGQAQAFVVGGGIGQRFIQIVIEAKRTTRLSYSALIFGY